jgi:pimeloyl-ACP methyl ester carboxylesterase
LLREERKRGEGLDIKLNFIEKGEGKPLLLLHGNGEDNSYFKYQIDEFAEHFHTLALDTRGHGKSPRGSAPFTIEQFAEDLRCFMDDMGIEKAHILGFSDGGNIAMVFACRYPERVDRLILNGANFSTKGLKKSFQIPVDIGAFVLGRLSKKIPALRKKAELLGLMAVDPIESPKELKCIRAKTLVVAGTADLIKASHTRELASYIPDSELCFIKGPHAVARLNPREYNRRVLEFLK